MNDNSLSEAEKCFIIQGVQDNIRNDGRSCLDYRTIELLTGVIPNSQGSAVVKVGETKVIAAVKAELGTPLPRSPNKGHIQISVENTPHANVEYEGRGGDDLACEASQILNEVCNNGKFMDLKKLCVIPGAQVWILNVDILVTGYGGNLMDIVSIAIKAALFNTRLQTVNIKTDANNVPEIEFSEDPHDLYSLNVTDLPCLFTLTRIGNEFIIDATREEEACSKAKILLGIGLRRIVLLKEIGGPGSLHPDSVNDITEIGHVLGIKLQKQLHEILEAEKKIPKNKKYFVP